MPRSTGGRVCVVGEFARTPRYQGAGSSQVNHTRASTPTSASCAAPARTCAPGVDLADPSRNPALADEAVAAASHAAQ